MISLLIMRVCGSEGSRAGTSPLEGLSLSRPEGEKLKKNDKDGGKGKRP